MRELAAWLGVSLGHLQRVEKGQRGGFGPRYAGILEKAIGGSAEEWVRRAADSRSVIGFALGPGGAGPQGRATLTVLWAKYRSMTAADWERVRMAILSDGFPEPEEADLPERVVEYDE